MMSIDPVVIQTVSLNEAPWQCIDALLTECYPRPPQDVFPKIVAATHERQKMWMARSSSKLIGIVMLSPYSKGGHLENLAVVKEARGKGIAASLVKCVIDHIINSRGEMVTITTRIPNFFSKLGFFKVGDLSDGSIAMIYLNSQIKPKTVEP